MTLGRRIGVALAGVLILGLLVPGQARGSASVAGGGPTSALLAAQHLERTASLSASDERYPRLLSLVDSGVAAGEAGTLTGPHAAGPHVTVTWLIHDVMPWRVDRIYPDAPGGVWIATSEDQLGQFTAKVVWHRSADAAGLLRLLAGLGLGGGRGDAGQSAAPPTAYDVDAAGVGQAAAPGADAGTPSPAAGGAAHRWTWALAGLAAGLVLGLAGVRAVPAWRRRAPSDRWQLVDLD